MILPRRRILRLALGAAALPLASRLAYAQAYPNRPARIVSGFPPGGISDTYARLIAQWLSDHLGQQFIVENRPGAGGNLAAETIAKSAPDGYSLLLTTSADAWNATLYKNPGYNITHDFAPVAPISRGPGVLVVNLAVPVKSVPELIAYANNNPGKVTVASAGIGSAPHMYWELFRSKTRVNMVHVPYRGGGPAIADLLGGHVEVYFATTAAAIGHIKAGRLRPLGVTTANPLPALPGVPPIGQFVPGYEATIYVGIAAPRGTPAEIVKTLAAQLNTAATDVKMDARIAELGDTPLALSTAAFEKLVADEAQKWAEVIKAAGVRAE